MASSTVQDFVQRSVQYKTLFNGIDPKLFRVKCLSLAIKNITPMKIACKIIRIIIIIIVSFFSTQ